MTVNKILSDIRKELKKNVDPLYKKGSLNFFKEKVLLYGVRSPQLKKIESSFWQRVKILNKKDFIKLTEVLFKSNLNEEFSLGCGWLNRRIDEFTAADFKILKTWLKKYVTNWAMCDDYCAHPLGYFIYKYPQFIKQTKKWTADKNRWVKRAAAVVHIHPTKKSSPFFVQINKNKTKYLKDVFEISDKLLTDAEDLVQKGYGWMLKEAANLFQKNIFDFIIKRKHSLPRTALRYAIEKMPAKLKKRAMR
ncbi:MAG TPA: DNA alkylation repair protein [Patescibacteria group bacterium]|nr:DNA alkylation repair protein [Patescibacteria group bacterium]